MQRTGKQHSLPQDSEPHTEGRDFRRTRRRGVTPPVSARAAGRAFHSTAWTPDPTAGPVTLRMCKFWGREGRQNAEFLGKRSNGTGKAEKCVRGRAGGRGAGQKAEELKSADLIS